MNDYCVDCVYHECEWPWANDDKYHFCQKNHSEFWDDDELFICPDFKEETS